MGETQTGAQGGKTGSVFVFYIVSDRDQLANKHMCPSFSRSSLAIMRQITLLWQHSTSKIKAGCCAPYGTWGTIPGRVHVWRQVLGVQVSSSWFVLMVLWGS